MSTLYVIIVTEGHASLYHNLFINQIGSNTEYDLFLGYVDKLKHLLFTLPKCEMEKVLQKYSAKTPEPLNRQFPDRLSKEEAVLSFKARKQKKKTSLFPSSKFLVAILITICWLETKILSKVESNSNLPPTGTFSDSDPGCFLTNFTRDCSTPEI